MNVEQKKQMNMYNKDPQEQILVVPTQKLFPHGALQGFSPQSINEYVTIIEQEKLFLPRNDMETNPAYKQVIPYLIFRHQDYYFLMQRSKNASEKRLQNKYTLGIGGHIREEDMKNRTLAQWSEREFHEEVSYQERLHIRPIGLVNDDSNSVGQVHLGLVLLVEGASNNISVKSELAHGFLATHEECISYLSSMESWSALIVPYLSPDLR